MSRPVYRAPIIVMAFNRPHYLEEVLQSLRTQRNCKIDERRIFLFQDGGKSGWADEIHADIDTLRASVSTFNKLIPRGRVWASDLNLGVALNFDRAERFAFEDLEAEAAIFLEDDLVLSPYYINTLDHLITYALEEPRVGYVAAYGNHTAPYEMQLQRRSDFTALFHNWGFGLVKRQWLAQRPYVDQYLDIIRRANYRQRDVAAISELFKSWGVGVPGTSQDCAKSLACVVTGAVKINTFACFARYIGATGLHMNPKAFEQRGYSKTQVFGEEVLNFQTLDDHTYQRIYAEQKRWAMSSMVS